MKDLEQKYDKVVLQNALLKSRIRKLESILETCMVDCNYCGDQEDADGELEGWRLRNGKWTCPECREEMAKEAADEEKFLKMRGE